MTRMEDPNLRKLAIHSRASELNMPMGFRINCHDDAWSHQLYVPFLSSHEQNCQSLPERAHDLGPVSFNEQGGHDGRKEASIRIKTSLDKGSTK
jgi:hypothetical protein